jgi:xylose isomerase
VVHRQRAKPGAWGFNFHDDDLVPFGSSAAETDRILREAKRSWEVEGIVIDEATHDPPAMPPNGSHARSAPG